MVHKSDSDELAALRAENARLVSLLEAHGIEWRRKPPISVQRVSVLSTNEKVALFRRLFRGRDDVWALRWESKTSGKSGYSPACANEWQLGICGKPRIKCGDCTHRQLIPVSDLVIYHHLAGTHTAGLYPLLEDDSCYFLAVDFDEAEWQKDASAFMRSCDERVYPLRWKYPVHVRERMSGYFFPHEFRPTKLAVWGLLLLAIRVVGPDNCD